MKPRLLIQFLAQHSLLIKALEYDYYDPEVYFFKDATIHFISDCLDADTETVYTWDNILEFTGF